MIKRNPLHFGALSGYGQVYLRLHEYGKAAKYFRRALALNPNLDAVEPLIRRLEALAHEKRRGTIQQPRIASPRA